jgi:hypothetical protein
VVARQDEQVTPGLLGRFGVIDPRDDRKASSESDESAIERQANLRAL